MAPLQPKLQQPDDVLRKLFKSLATPEDIATLLEVPNKTLHFYIYKKSNYQQFVIKKASGGVRDIASPDSSLKILQRKFAHILYLVHGSRSAVHGFAKSRSIKTNASRHLGAQWVLNFDLLDFFPTIHYGRIAGLFRGKPHNLPTKVAATLARLCCCNASLPAGAPTSPVLANMICAKLDSELKALAWTFGCTYTRYADDITFSVTANGFPKEIVTRTAALNTWELSDEIVKIIKKNSFAVNPHKTRVRGRNASQEVTGVRINSGLNVSRKLHRQIRAMLHAWETWGEAAAQSEFEAKYESKQKLKPHSQFRDVLRGKIEFVGFIRGRDSKSYVTLLQRLQALDSSVRAKPVIVSGTTNESILQQAIWLLMDKDDKVQGTAFAVQGNRLLTAAHNLNDFMYASRPSFDSSRYLVTETNRDNDLDVAEGTINTFLPVQLKIRAPEPIALMSSICVVGFPNYHIGDSVAFRFGKIVQSRKYLGIPHFVIDADIVKGNSGGPIIDSANLVIGLAVKGLAAPGSLGAGDQVSSFVPITPDIFSKP